MRKKWGFFFGRMPMTRKTPLLAAAAMLTALTLSSAAPPTAFAADERACLQNNRIWGWRALDQRTLLLTDINNRRFLVRLSGGCIGLNDAIFALQVRTTTNLGCLMRGDRVSYRAPALGEMSCFVQDVEPYEMKPGERYDQPYVSRE
jgi:hypothetical protein